MNAMLSLPIEGAEALLQRGFADAIFFDDSPIPATIRAASGPASTSRFGVYRNNVIAGLINAIAARYPVVRKLLWPETFDRVTRLYIVSEPPRSAILLNYGDGFPQFLRLVGKGVSAEYVADIAELEAARTRAYHAADATPLGRDVLARIAVDELPNLRLRLHPSASLLTSRFPVIAIWEANLYANDNSISRWNEESALIVRPHLDVNVWRLSAGTYEFLSAIAKGQSVDTAVAYAVAAVPEFDLSKCFNILIAAEVVVGFDRGEP